MISKAKCKQMFINLISSGLLLPRIQLGVVGLFQLKFRSYFNSTPVLCLDPSFDILVLFTGGRGFFSIFPSPPPFLAC
jgi:hypothetical protein